MHDTYRVSEQRACGVARIPVSTFRYESRQEPRKLVYCLYREEGLALRHKPRRKGALHRRERFQPTVPNQVWGLDFVADQLADERRFRVLTILGVFTRESLTIGVGQGLKEEDVVRELNTIRQKRGVPKLVFCDNGSEFTSQT